MAKQNKEIRGIHTCLLCGASYEEKSQACPECDAPNENLLPPDVMRVEFVVELEVWRAVVEEAGKLGVQPNTFIRSAVEWYITDIHKDKRRKKA